MQIVGTSLVALLVCTTPLMLAVSRMTTGIMAVAPDAESLQMTIRNLMKDAAAMRC